jgi:uncharacterized membrane protein YedE/YeeE
MKISKITWDTLKELIVQGFWFCLLASIMYFGLKAPIMYFFTGMLGINYILGGFFAGVIVTVITFFFSKFWIFRGKGGDNNKRKWVPVL